MISPYSLDCKQFDVHLMSRPQFVDENVILGWTWVGQPRLLFTARFPFKVFGCNMTVIEFTRLTSLAASDIETEVQSVPTKAIELFDIVVNVVTCLFLFPDSTYHQANQTI